MLMRHQDMLCSIHSTEHWASCCWQFIRQWANIGASTASHNQRCCEWHTSFQSVLQVFDGHNGRMAGELASNYMLSNLQRCLVSSQATSVEDALVRSNNGHLDLHPVWW